ncbi:hypothetical protein CDAR_46161 [Caerostris darwini]|uniref:Uncharacterized protein n=1 Tax=Caerostris darwini TaxID=1538125 RepID=A0AAV4PI37_9ARAC|nr:hypothetical protein CDAR_46161 [Caerostris darwini]
MDVEGVAHQWADRQKTNLVQLSEKFLEGHFITDCRALRHTHIRNVLPQMIFVHLKSSPPPPTPSQLPFVEKEALNPRDICQGRKSARR